MPLSDVTDRLMKTEVEVEMEIETRDGEPPQTVIRTEEEEEVVLCWQDGDGDRTKNIRELATGYQRGVPEDKAILDYYR